MRRTTRAYLAALCLLGGAACSPGLADELRSGPAPGRRPGPYTSVVSVGPERGTLHCYICESEDRPVVIVFARSMTDALGELVQKIDRALPEYDDEGMRSWVTFLYDDHTAVDRDVVAWGKKHALRNVPLGVFEDVGGPPAYLLSPDADVTVLLSVNQQVVANFAFRAGELDDAAVARILQALPALAAAAK